MKDYIEERAVEIAGYIIETKDQPVPGTGGPECAGHQQAGASYPGWNGDQGEVSTSWRVKIRNEKEKNKTENIRQENRREGKAQMDIIPSAFT